MKKTRSPLLPWMLLTAAAAVIVAVITNLGAVWNALAAVFRWCSPIFTGLAAAYVLRPPVRKMEDFLVRFLKKKPIATGIAVTVTYLVAAAAVFFLARVLVPQLLESVSSLAGNLSRYFVRYELWIRQLSTREFFSRLDLSRLVVTYEEVVGALLRLLEENLSVVLNTVFGVGISLARFLISLAISIYLLLDWDRIVEGVFDLGGMLFPKRREKRLAFYRKCDEIFSNYIRSNFLDAVIIGFTNFLVMLILGYPYAVLISVVVAVSNVIPSIGPIIGAAPCALILLLINPWQALGFLVVTAILQLLDAYILKPRIFGAAVGIPGLLIIVSILVGGKIAGMLGMLVSVPVVALLYSMLNDAVAHREETRGLTPMDLAGP